MKRHHRQVEEDDEHESAEMDVDTEEKVEPDETDQDTHSESDEDDAEGDSQIQRQPVAANPFLDAFYGLSSVSGKERAQAAQVILHHALVGPDANAKDAAYAFRRLLNGLCSGRAAARQGNAAALAKFVMIATIEDKLDAVQLETLKEGEKSVSSLLYLRNRLLAATNPNETQGRRKGSEERDYQFGRLFGIMAIFRSGVLCPSKENKADLNDILVVATGFLTDLANLYEYKNWMREPAAHAIGTMLNSYYAVCPKDNKAVKIIDHLVKTLSTLELLTKGDVHFDDDDDDEKPLYAKYSAEQVAIVAHIQANVHLHGDALPSPLDQPILTKDTIPLLAGALSEVSSVTQPRMHLVWDTIWILLTESAPDQGTQMVDLRIPRQSVPVGDDSLHDILEGLFRYVVIEKLLGLENDAGFENGKTTHERRALALCIVRNLAGAEFVSSVSGRTVLNMEVQLLEDIVLTTVLVQRLFVDVICAGTVGGSKKQSEHMLKPLSLQVLDSILASFSDDFRSDMVTRRLMVVRAFLDCEPRFDTRTKTTFIADLLGILSYTTLDAGRRALLNEFVSYLEIKIARAATDAKLGVSTYDAIGFVDWLFGVAKVFLRSEITTETTARPEVRRIISFLSAAAFFDCKSSTVEFSKNRLSTKKKGKKRSPSLDESVKHPVIAAASLLKNERIGLNDFIPYDVRIILSARYYSLLADIVATTLRSSDSLKEKNVLDQLSDTIDGIHTLVSMGVHTFGLANKEEGMETNDSPNDIVLNLRRKAYNIPATSEKPSKCVTAFAILASTLYLHLYTSGRPADVLADDDLDADDGNDHEELVEAIADVSHVATLFESGCKEGDYPLRSLAELCANLLSSPLSFGSNSKGASPKMIREVVKLCWTGGLVHSALSKNNVLDSQVMAILLGGIGVTSDSIGEDMNLDEEEEDDDSDSESSGDDISTMSKKETHAPDAENVGESVWLEEISNEEEEVELDSSNLQSLLEEENDTDVELEHHEGADAALAKLILLRQDARKTGQQARERLAIAQYQRCVLLLETAVLGKPEGWGSLLRTNGLLNTIVPLIQYRKALEKDILKSTDKGSLARTGEKRSFMDKITSLLKMKIYKVRTSTIEWSEDCDQLELATSIATWLLSEIKSNSTKEHKSCCSGGLMFVLKALKTSEDKLTLAGIFSTAVDEWSSKKSTRLESSFFEQLIQTNPVIAQLCLVEPVCRASLFARSAYLKSEGFRLMALLYNLNINPGLSSNEVAALNGLDVASGSFFVAVWAALQDEEMKKSKRIREVLKSTEKVLAYCSARVDSSDNIGKKDTMELRELLRRLRDDSESHGIAKVCTKLVDDFATLVEKLDTKAEANEAATNIQSSISKKKKKGKKKK
jgi:hypothetical protein